MTELTTSKTDSGLSITIFRYVIPRKGSLLGFLSVLHYTSLILSSEFSGSLLSSSIVLVSPSLVTTTTEDHNCLRELVAEMSLFVQTFTVTIIRDITMCIRI